MTDNTIEPYSNRELDQILKSVTQRMDEGFGTIHARMDNFESETSTDLGEIKTQTQKTNGRVSKLENWRIFIAGGVAVLTFLVSVLLAVLAIVASSGHL